MNGAILKAIDSVCDEDQMDNEYRDALKRLIENAMLNKNNSYSDIINLLDKIDVNDTTNKD